MSSGKLKIVLGYPDFPSNVYGDVGGKTREYIQRLNKAGFDVEGVCLTLNPPAHRLSWFDLDRMWKTGDKLLLDLYEKLERVLDGKDVFINQVGINLHPDFVRELSVFTVYQCFDDPESSKDLSQPVATAYDLCLVGNIAEVDRYRSWGVKNVKWQPLGIMDEFYDKKLTFNQVLNQERDVDIFMIADRLSPWRKRRLDVLADAFPNAHFYGQGWERGFLPVNQEISYLQRTKICPNLHNSTGPINHRTFYLPANGVMQICDNKSHLGRIFELDKEVVGFDTLKECLDLCNYYLNHDEERRVIAANGWKRAVNDYNEVAVFSRAIDMVRQSINVEKMKLSKVETISIRYARNNSKKIIINRVYFKFAFLLRTVISVLRKIYGKFYV